MQELIARLREYRHCRLPSVEANRSMTFAFFDALGVTAPDAVIDMGAPGVADALADVLARSVAARQGSEDPVWPVADGHDYATTATREAVARLAGVLLMHPRMVDALWEADAPAFTSYLSDLARGDVIVYAQIESLQTEYTQITDPHAATRAEIAELEARIAELKASIV